MAQQHLDRLTAVDASFLAQEGPASHMHIGGLVICEGPAPGYEEMLDHIRTRLHLVPRYRQRLAQPPMETGRPLWVDDPTFNLEYHVRQTALPSPGSEDQLMRLVARIMSQQLDRSKPLWEMWIIEGLDDGGFALISKTHHALIDGISGVDLATVMFDLTPVPPEVPHSDEPWQPQHEPTGAELVAGGAIGLARGRGGRRGQRAGHRAQPAGDAARARRGGRGPWRGRLGGAEPGAGDAAERRDRPASPLPRRAQPARGLQGGQERVRRHRQRRGLDRRQRRAARLAALTRRAHRGAGAARARPRVHAGQGRAGPSRQPHHRDARAAAGLHRRPDRAAARGQGVDGRLEGVQAGGWR